MAITTNIKLVRDKTERPSGNWVVGYYKWKLTAPCAVCKKPYTDSVSGTKSEVLRMIEQGRWHHDHHETPHVEWPAPSDRYL